MELIQSDLRLAETFPSAFVGVGGRATPTDEYFGIRLSGYVLLDEVPKLIADAIPAIETLTKLIDQVGASVEPSNQRRAPEGT